MKPGEIIERLLREAEDVRKYHKARGEKGRIEALGASIRLKALKDALRALKEQP